MIIICTVQKNILLNSCTAEVKILFILGWLNDALTLFHSESEQEFRLWIMDPKHVSDAEKNETALFPPQVGSIVSKL